MSSGGAKRPSDLEVTLVMKPGCKRTVESIEGSVTAPFLGLVKRKGILEAEVPNDTLYIMSSEQNNTFLDMAEQVDRLNSKAAFQQKQIDELIIDSSSQQKQIDYLLEDRLILSETLEYETKLNDKARDLLLLQSLSVKDKQVEIDFVRHQNEELRMTNFVVTRQSARRYAKMIALKVKHEELKRKHAATQAELDKERADAKKAADAAKEAAEDAANARAASEDSDDKKKEASLPDVLAQLVADFQAESQAACPPEEKQDGEKIAAGFAALKKAEEDFAEARKKDSAEAPKKE